MSDTDPYAAPEWIVFEEARDVSISAAPQVAEKAPEEVVEEVPTGSIKVVLAWVGDDAEKAQKALDAELTGDQRSSLISKLEEIIN